MIGVLNYGLGNVSAFINIFNKLGFRSKLVDKPLDLYDTNKLILPGVGAFDYAIQAFNDSGLRDDVERLVLIEKTPVLGVCVGFQMMAKTSDEGNLKGLDWIDATVEKIEPANLPEHSPLPHMGWNRLNVIRDDPLLVGLNDSKFYFLHSYFVSMQNQATVIGTAQYGNEFCSVMRSDNICGMQCHPEKSHSYGVNFLKNFAEL